MVAILRLPEVICPLGYQDYESRYVNGDVYTNALDGFRIFFKEYLQDNTIN